jgi:hypothetical protein
VFDIEKIDTGDATTEVMDSEIRRLLQVLFAVRANSIELGYITV